jgi:hypothetical protein
MEQVKNTVSGTTVRKVNECSHYGNQWDSSFKKLKTELSYNHVCLEITRL